MSIISPTWSGQDIKQALGRIHRAGSKSPAIQKIIFCAKTCEEQVSKTVKSKLINISAINDNDLAGPQFKIESYKETLNTQQFKKI